MAKTAQTVEEKTEETKGQQDEASQQDSKKQAQSVEFSEVDATGAAGAGASFDVLLDMNVPVIVSIGQTRVPIRQLLQLGPGSVLKLDKSVDEPADLYIEDAKFADGTVVVVDGRFAVKIKQILGPGSSAAEPTED